MSQLSILLQLVGSRMKAQEFLFLLKDKKPVIRQGYYDHELPVIGELCVELGLHLKKSDFKVELAENGFANKGLQSDKGLSFLYISKSAELAEQAMNAEKQYDHKLLGELLGYPSCCITYFQSVFSESNTNPQHHPTRWETNISLRPKDWCLLSHFPCTNECETSIHLANDFLELIQSDNDQWAKELKRNLETF